jgi:hypothetical protein
MINLPRVLVKRCSSSAAMLVHESRDVRGIEAQQPSPLHVPQAPLLHESPHVAHVDTQVLRDIIDRQQRVRRRIPPHSVSLGHHHLD